MLNLKARSISSSSLLVEWEPPEKARGEIKNYIIQYQPLYEEKKKEVVVKEMSSGSDVLWAKLPDLEENTLYQVNVSARNARWIGEW